MMQGWSANHGNQATSHSAPGAPEPQGHCVAIGFVVIELCGNMNH